MIVGEDDADALATRMASGAPATTSPVALFEAVMAVARATLCPPADARQRVMEFTQLFDIAVRPVDQAAFEFAVHAQANFGKGRHPAALNMGDCFAYGSARAMGAALLVKGNDFGQTDILQA